MQQCMNISYQEFIKLKAPLKSTIIHRKRIKIPIEVKWKVFNLCKSDQNKHLPKHTKLLEIQIN